MFVCQSIFAPQIFYKLLQFRFKCKRLFSWQVKRKTVPSKMDFNSWNTFWDICFGVLVTLIIVGNVLTIWIFFKQRRQKRTYSLLMSLAVADFWWGFLLSLFI